MNVPQLRFDGFDGEWKQRELSELLEFKNGINADKDSYGHGTKFINVLDILNNDYILSENIIGSVNATAQQLQTYSVTHGDILFLRSSETREDVGKCNVYLDEEKPSVFGGFVIRGKKIANYSPFFLKTALNNSSARNQISSKAGGSTRYNVGQGILSEVTVKIPEIEEQQKISSFLMLFNQKIEKQQEKIEKLEQFKKGMMQKIFSQELRFKDEDGGEFGEWEMVEFSERFTIIDGDRGHNYPNSNEYLEEGFCLFLNAKNVTKNGFIFDEKAFIDELKDKSMMKGKMEKNDIVLTSRGTIGNIAHYSSEVSYENIRINSGMLILRSKVNESAYNYAFLKSPKFEKQIKFAVFGSAQPQLTVKDVKKMKINYPGNFQEQQKIALFFTKIEWKLEKEIEKLMVLEKQKKGFMHGMFV